VNTLLQKHSWDIPWAAPNIQKNSSEVVPQPQYPIEHQPKYEDDMCKSQLAEIEVGLAEVQKKKPPVDAYINSFNNT